MLPSLMRLVGWWVSLVLLNGCVTTAHCSVAAVSITTILPTVFVAVTEASATSFPVLRRRVQEDERPSRTSVTDGDLSSTTTGTGNMTMKHEIAFLTPATNFDQNRRVRKTKAKLYWAAVFLLLGGFAMSIVTIIFYVLDWLPSFCYPPLRRTDDDDDGTSTKKKTSFVDTVNHQDHDKTNRSWWMWSFLSSWMPTSLSDTTTTTSTETTSSTDSASILHDGSCRSLEPNDDAIVVVDEMDDNGKENHDANVAFDDTVTKVSSPMMIHRTMAFDYDEEIDHTILVDVYQHYIYKGDDDIDDITNHHMYY